MAKILCGGPAEILIEGKKSGSRKKVPGGRLIAFSRWKQQADSVLFRG
jgi:hypothetical protein